MSDNPRALSPNKAALLKIRELKQQLSQAKQGEGEPIAIASMACRFPRTSDTPEKFWESLIRQDDLVSDVPDDRWDLDAFVDDDPEVPGKMYARKGVFLDGLDQMDPEFFGISPREATWVDPQQRLLMELGWEAIERAGWAVENIADRTGVFVGWMHNDYQNEASDSFLNLNPYIATGAAGSFLAGRLAHCLGVNGPSIAVDSACSSSLVALHLAIQSLQRGDCDRALVGGVNAICSPTTNILTCKLKALSPSGHSRAFDAAADGYLRGEGGGLVTLQRLSDAKRDRVHILGVIRGSAVGHNGGGAGLTVPNPKAQQAVIEEALKQSGISAEEVDYLEAHGTGTELGDPIEVNAAAAAYCAQRDNQNPLLIGSVKTNIGHLEAAAGMAGLIKVLLAIQNDSIPGQMNFETPNPHIPWDQIPVKVITSQTEWPHPHRRIAGVSAFGMSGTNAHVIIEAPESETAKQRRTQSPSVTSTDQPSIITLSAKSEEALWQLADAYAQKLVTKPSIDVAGFAAQSNLYRGHFQFRAAVVAKSREEVIGALKTLAAGGSSAEFFVGQHRRPPKVAWMFTGQGSQFLEMGKQLYDSQAVYRQALDQCDEQLKSLRNRSLLEVIFGDHSAGAEINHTHWSQPAIFALQMGLVKLYQHWGLEPDVVFGHSVGQFAAACTAGILDWEDGLTLIAERGRLMGELPAGGKMLAVFLAEQEVRPLIAELPSVSIAATNISHIVVSGASAEIDALEQQLVNRRVRVRPLATSHAFHSELMTPVLKPFANVASQINFRKSQLPLICNISGRVIPPDHQLTGEYWASHIRQPVAFAASVKTAEELNCDFLVEFGPQAVLSRMAAGQWQPTETMFSVLNKEQYDVESTATSLARMYAQGLTLNFAKLNKGVLLDGNDLPTYPFQRRRFWGPAKPRAEHAELHTAHPLLGGRISLAGNSQENRFESHIEPDSPAWLSDHEVAGAVVLPGAALIEMAIEAADGSAVEKLVFEQPIRPTDRTALQTVVTQSADTASRKLNVFARAASENNWSRHFSCELTTARPDPQRLDLVELKSGLPEKGEPGVFYQRMNELGLSYGPAFRCIEEIHFSDREVLTKLNSESDIRGHHVAPNLLDAALHSLAVGLLKTADEQLFLPVAINRVNLHADVEGEVWCHARWNSTAASEPSNDGRTADIQLTDDKGKVLLSIEGLQVKAIDSAVLRQLSGAGAERLVYDIAFKPQRFAPQPLSPKKWLLVYTADQQTQTAAFVEQFQQQLADRGHEITELALTGEADRSIETAFDSLSNDAGFEFDGVSWLLNGDGTTSENFVSNDAIAVMTFVQSLLSRSQRRLPCGLQLITQTAIAANEHDQVDASQSQLWGLGRVIAAEQPELKVRLLDVVPAQLNESGTISLIADLATTETVDNQHAIRDESLWVPRLKQASLTAAKPVLIKPDGCYLVTGGLGMLGRQVAMWLASGGARQVVLVSRRKPEKQALEFIQTIEQTGCQVVVRNADVSKRADVESLFASFGRDLNPLAGIVHAAGVLDDGLLESQNRTRFQRVLEPKIAAALLLEEFSRGCDLDLFILYSSVASVLGSPGQSNYAVGNAFLDGLAHQRRAAGLPAVAINWGPWQAGMADDERIVKRLALQGIAPLSNKESHQALEKILAADVTQATVIDVDWRKMRMGSTGEPAPMLEALVGSQKKSRGADSALVGRLKKLKGGARRQLLVKTIQDTFQNILATNEAPETDRPLIEMGLDSLMAVEFGTALQQMLGDAFNVGPTMLFDYPTIEAISDYLLELITADAATDNEVQPPANVTESASTKTQAKNATIREDIAIVGMSCRFPGAENVQQFWQNLLDGVDSVCDIPSDRWDIDRFYSEDREPGKMYTRQGGFLNDLADFDAEFFNISDQEACWIDPQHRMLLENSYRALEDAGIKPAPLADANVGVFMGIMGSDYAFLPTLDDESIIQGFQGAGLSHSAGVGRISYLLGFEGPSVAIDTASSSSLVAVFQAMRSLQDGNCNLALAGGVNAILAPVNSLLMSKAGLLSPDGRCRSFSQDANGFGRGEGCGVVVLKRLSDAQRDGDRIMAVIRGGAVGHNGFSGGITSPSGKAQSRVIDAAIKDAAIAPSEVQYLEAHGTATEFGDPMELGAAAKIYGKGRRKDQPLLVGSVKANISHLEAAGGASGLIKTVLAIHHGVIPRQIHCDNPSPHIPWKRMPVELVTENRPWPDCQRRSAGITALGLVGTNAHLIISAEKEKNVECVTTETSPQRKLLPVSAKTEASLQTLCHSYAHFLESDSTCDLDDFCYTLATGRRHYSQRIAVEFDSQSDLIEKLRGMKTGAASPAKTKTTWVFGNSESNLDYLQTLIRDEPEIADFISRCDERLRQDHGVSLQDAMADEHRAFGELNQFLLQAGLCQLWQHWGLDPDAVAGFGVGQYVAACAAGCLCFFDAMVLIYQGCRIGGATANSDQLDEFEAFADQFNFYPPNTPLICSLTGEVVAVHRSLGGSYWRQHLTEPAKFDASLNALQTTESDVVLVFAEDDQTLIKQLGLTNRTIINTLSRSESKPLKALAMAYRAGCDLNFAAIYSGENRRKLSLPTYPFQKRRYWITEVSQFATNNPSQKFESAYS